LTPFLPRQFFWLRPFGLSVTLEGFVESSGFPSKEFFLTFFPLGPPSFPDPITPPSCTAEQTKRGNTCPFFKTSGRRLSHLVWGPPLFTSPLELVLSPFRFFFFFWWFCGDTFTYEVLSAVIFPLLLVSSWESGYSISSFQQLTPAPHLGRPPPPRATASFFSLACGQSIPTETHRPEFYSEALSPRTAVCPRRTS